MFIVPCIAPSCVHTDAQQLPGSSETGADSYCGYALIKRERKIENTKIFHKSMFMVAYMHQIVVYMHSGIISV